MTKQERMRKALQHEQPDFAPNNIDLTWQAAKRLSELEPNYLSMLENHTDSAYNDGFLTEIRPEYWRGDFGVIRNRTGADKDIGVISGILLPDPDLSEYELPTLDEARLARMCRRKMCWRCSPRSANNDANAHLPAPGSDLESCAPRGARCSDANRRDDKGV